MVRDDHGIPQIYADTTDDLMCAQGFVHAQERFFEMDVRRHATAGRLAELFGEDAVETDVYVRTMGWRRVAEQELPLLDPDTRAALDAYADGVNAYLDDRSPSEIALEYTRARRRRPRLPPRAVDRRSTRSAWLKAMAWDLRGNMADEIDRALDRGGRGPGAGATSCTRPTTPTRAPRSSTQGAVVDGVFEQDADAGAHPQPDAAPRRSPPGRRATCAALAAARLGRMPAWLGRGDGLGSNSWVVVGRAHRRPAQPMLANDPHLGVSLPGVWMQVGLHCRTVGAGLPLRRGRLLASPACPA